MEFDADELIGHLRSDPHFESLYDTSSFLLNRGILELLRVVAAIHSPRAPQDVKDVLSTFSPLLWLANWLKLNNPQMLPYSAAIASSLTLPSHLASAPSAVKALELVSLRASLPHDFQPDPIALTRAQTRATEIAKLSVSLFIECRRMERVREADETRLQRQHDAEQDYLLQLRLRDQARKLRADPPMPSRRRGQAATTGSTASTSGTASPSPAPRGADKKSSARKQDDAQLSLCPEVPEEPPLVPSTAETADLAVYVESPEEVLARAYTGCLRKDTLVACIYEDPDALALLRLPPRRPGTYPPFSSLFRDVAPADPPLLGPGPGPLCECLWALAFRTTTPITLPYTYGIPGAHPPVCTATATPASAAACAEEAGAAELPGSGSETGADSWQGHEEPLVAGEAQENTGC